MPRARICQDCACDISAAAPRPEPIYGFLVVNCPRCGAFAHYLRRSIVPRVVRLLLNLAVRLGLMCMALGVVAVVSHVHDRDLHQYGLDPVWIVKLAEPDSLPDRFNLYLTRDINDTLGLLILRLAGAMLLSFWIVFFTNFRPPASALLLGVVVVAAAGSALLIQTLETFGLGPTFGTYSIFESAESVFGVLVTLVISMVFATAINPFRTRFRNLFRSLWFRSKLRNARKKRRA